MSIYRGMDKPTLDLAYCCTKTLQDYPAAFAEMQRKSVETYKKHEHKANLKYGTGERNTYDFFPAKEKGAPTFIFIHGGYWQSCVKEDFTYVAEGPLAKGFNVILFEYTIAPVGTMTSIVQELYQFLDHIEENLDNLGLTRGQICLSGHSAGGHLTLEGKDHNVISHAIPISPLVDLEPISLCYLNDNLHLTKEEIALYSPIKHVRKSVPLAIYVGGYELAELIRHSEEYCIFAKGLGNVVTSYSRCKQHNHFSVLDELVPEGDITVDLVKLMKH